MYVLQCVAVCVLQCVAVCVLQCVAVCGTLPGNESRHMYQSVIACTRAVRTVESAKSGKKVCEQNWCLKHKLLLFLSCMKSGVWFGGVKKDGLP